MILSKRARTKFRTSSWVGSVKITVLASTGEPQHGAISARRAGKGSWPVVRLYLCTADQVPRARFIGYARGGHMLVGHEDEFAAETLRFLDALRPGVTSDVPGSW